MARRRGRHTDTGRAPSPTPPANLAAGDPGCMAGAPTMVTMCRPPHPVCSMGRCSPLGETTDAAPGDGSRRRR